MYISPPGASKFLEDRDDSVLFRTLSPTPSTQIQLERGSNVSDTCSFHANISQGLQVSVQG